MIEISNLKRGSDNKMMWNMLVYRYENSATK